MPIFRNTKAVQITIILSLPFLAVAMIFTVA